MMKSKPSDVRTDLLDKDITDVWNVSKDDIKDINNKITKIEKYLNDKYRGHYFDFQIVEDFFSTHTDYEKAMIFIYGQLVHDRIYNKN